MPAGQDYADTIKTLREKIHADVAALLDSAKQKRRFPKRSLENFLKKKEIKKLLPNNIPDEITKLVNSTEKLTIIPSEVLRTFLDPAWDRLPKSLKRAIEGTKDLRPPTQASSNFLINRELGDWAENAVLKAVNGTRLEITAVHYGRIDKLILGENGFKELFQEHMQELKSIGKRPDILIYRKTGAPPASFEGKTKAEMVELAKAAIAGFEIRSSHQAITQDRLGELSFTPKIEDIDNVVRWIEQHKVPHFYVQVLFGGAYAIGFDEILKVLASSPKEGAYTIAKKARNQFKATIYIPLNKGVPLSSDFKKPTELKGSIKELPEGRVVIIVEFAGGGIELSEDSLARLIDPPAPGNLQ